jgi:hypothetical protein
MLKGAKYERNSRTPEEGFLDDPWNELVLSWKTIQLVERRKTSSTTETVVPEIPFKTMSRWAPQGKVKKLDGPWGEHIFKQATLTTDEYEWVCLVDGKPFTMGAEELEHDTLCHYSGYYDFVGFAD